MSGYKITILIIIACLSFIITGVYAQKGVLQDSDWQAALPCTGTETRPCGSNVGICEAGTRACTDNAWSECVGGIEPVTEICSNEIDDDCNGLTDECINSLWIIIIIFGVVIVIILWALLKI